jgi:hypothetical protein
MRPVTAMPTSAASMIAAVSERSVAPQTALGGTGWIWQLS